MVPGVGPNHDAMSLDEDTNGELDPLPCIKIRGRLGHGCEQAEPGSAGPGFIWGSSKRMIAAWIVPGAVGVVDLSDTYSANEFQSQKLNEGDRGAVVTGTDEPEHSGFVHNATTT